MNNIKTLKQMEDYVIGKKSARETELKNMATEIETICNDLEKVNADKEGAITNGNPSSYQKSKEQANFLQDKLEMLQRRQKELNDMCVINEEEYQALCAKVRTICKEEDEAMKKKASGIMFQLIRMCTEAQQRCKQGTDILEKLIVMAKMDKPGRSAGRIEINSLAGAVGHKFKHDALAFIGKPFYSEYTPVFGCQMTPQEKAAREEQKKLFGELEE